MKRLLLVLWLVTPAWAEPLSYQKEFELKLCSDPQKLAPPLRGDAEATMKLVRELYDLAGPKIGCRFVESVYLLSLGDQRPYGAWNGFMLDPQPADDETIDRLNAYLVPRGYSLHMHAPDPEGRVGAFSIHSLEGLDKRTRETHLSWIPRYHRESGWAGYYQWKREIYERLPRDGPFTVDRVEGVMLGYPDAAVDHQEEMVWSSWPSTISVFLPDCRYYTCGLPEFSLRWQDASEPGVVACEREWGDFLRRCWAAPAHRSLQAEPAFQTERRRLLSAGTGPERLPNGDARYAESRRLGFSWHGVESRELDSELERWLPAHREALQRALRETADLDEVARGSGYVRLRAEHLWAWILRGSCVPGEDTAALFASMREHQPQPLLQLYRRELNDRARLILRREAAKDPGWDGEPLAQMLCSSYCRSIFRSLSDWERRTALEAARARRDYLPLQVLLRDPLYAGEN